MIWFTSDTHFLHEAIIGYEERPFSSLDDMTEALIENWNKCVNKGDVIYHLGDFALSYGKKDAPKVDAILSRLNGSKWLIKGNHDRGAVTESTKWAMVKDYHEIKVDVGAVHKQRVVMFHYCLRTWSQQGRGAWCLHGHSHGNLPDIGGKVIDVGVDSNAFAPVSFDAISERMSLRGMTCEDHHREAQE